MKYCCDCAYMCDNANKNGLFKCENSRKSQYDLVSARMKSCDYFCGAWYSKRGSVRREEMMRVSREHGYYIMSALTELLNLDPFYCEYFKDFKENTEMYFQEFFNVYDIEGPKIETKLLNDPNALMYAKYLLTSYIDPFIKYVKIKKYYDAYEIYIELFDNLLVKYDCNDYVKCKK